ncbi:sensor histidine kinase [Pollutibacter soli]|uniref:sensor histidine kinase n=1 Tax=Pollutibacter soli TaxID=3034157 RepID=UPI003013FFC0
MILIVDDKQENIFSLKTLLQLNLYEVDTATSGEEALRKILQNDYALIILDVQMPGMDGFEVAESVASLNKTRDIPIIFLSAVNTNKRFITKGYGSGGVDYVTKPFDPDLLLLKVKTFYRLYEQTRELKKIQAALTDEIEMRKRTEIALQHANQHLEEKVQERTEELLRSNQALETSNTELAQYASVASHDLQEPLRKIATFSRIIQEKFLLPSHEAEKFMEKVILSSERMRILINDLLNYSKLSAVSHYTKTNLNQLLDGVIADLELSAKEKNADIRISELPEAEIIPGQIRQVFQNLLSNALKFVKKDCPSVIRIYGERILQKDFDSPQDPEGRFLRLYFEDNGIGFDEQYAEKIFTIFQRLHRREEYEGTGIGLAIVKKIIDNHNGILTAKSKTDSGTTFIIIIPLKQRVAFAATQS